MVARGRFELPSMGLFLVRESKAHHWPGHRFRPLLVHYTTGLQETRVSGQDPISLLRQFNQQFHFSCLNNEPIFQPAKIAWTRLEITVAFDHAYSKLKKSVRSCEEHGPVSRRTLGFGIQCCLVSASSLDRESFSFLSLWLAWRACTRLFHG